MSFRKRTFAKPNLGTNRKKTQEVNALDKDGEAESTVSNGETKNVESQSTSIAVGTRLFKRSKILPNVRTRNVPKEKNSQKIDTSLEDECEKIISTPNSPPLKDNITKNTEESQEEILITVKSDDICKRNKTQSNKLQKRLRVMPKLNIPKREPRKTAVEHSIQIDTFDGEITNSVDEMNPLHTKQTSVKEDLLMNEKNLEHDFKIDTNTNIDSNKSVETFEKNVNKKSGKQVHFENVTKTENEFETSSSVSKSFSRANRTEVSNTNTKDTSIIDYSSQSEGESSNVASSKSKKVFKPNLVAKRRKRLSSFSAYSSCDEDEDRENQRKPKTENFKTLIEEDEQTPEISFKPSENTSVALSKKRKEQQIKEGEDIIFDENEEPVKRVKRQRKMNRVCTEEKDLSKLTMQELIHYRPKSFRKAELRSNKNADNDLEEVAVLPPTEEQDGEVKNNNKPVEKEEESIGVEDEEDDVMAPQVMVDENGDIVVNEKSLMINKKVDDSILKSSSVIFEDSMTTNNHRRRATRIKRWKLEETLRFYKALSQIGTDFTLMSQAFGKFTRNELKKKFKQEEKVNCDLVDMALSNRLPLNMELFLRGKAEMKDLLAAEAESIAGNDEESTVGQPESIDGNSPQNNIETLEEQDLTLALKTNVSETTEELTETQNNEALQEEETRTNNVQDKKHNTKCSGKFSPFTGKRRITVDDKDK